MHSHAKWAPCTLAILFFVAAGQGPAQPPAFDAASVKPSASLDSGTDRDSSPGALTIRNFTLRNLIRVAYGVKDYQISGGPKWMGSDRYDVHAKAAGPADDPELLLMLRTLLAERFKLAVHLEESRPFQGYAMVLAKNGLKIEAAEDDGPHSTSSHRGSLTAKGQSMAGLAEWLGRRWNLPVADATGVTGIFDFKLEWTPEDSSPPALPTNEQDPALVAALQEQLGIKLVPRKVPMEMIVVDRAEKASEN